MLIYFLTILYFFNVVHPIPWGSKLTFNALTQKELLNKPLGYIEDAYLNFTELATKYGYTSEQHTVTTEDGYLLTIFRILPKCSQTQRFPIILGHGIFDSSDTWILTGPKAGLGYILSSKCYDVWAVNFRGNVYSRKHLRLDPNKDPAYWDFSFDENGLYDLPAFIDYVLHVTGQRKVYYIGHSQGSTDFFVMGSLRSDYNEKIQLSIQLAPIAWLKNIKSIIPKILSRKSKEIKIALEHVGLNELFAKHQITHLLPEVLCQIAPNGICGTALALSTGYKVGSITSLNLAIAIGHLLVGVSVKTLAHFAQLITSGQFQRYDDGVRKNIRKYGSVKPPDYNVSLITSPIVLISAKNDWLSTLEDLDTLISRLPNFIENYIVPVPTWSHNNHVWGINAKKLVFEKILRYLQTFNT